MDRKTRIANLKKLQLPGTGTKRGNRNKDVSDTSTATVSKYFVTPKKTPASSSPQEHNKEEENLEKPKTNNERKLRQYKRTKLDAFLFKDPKQLTNHVTPLKTPKDDDFITSPKRVKKAPEKPKSNTVQHTKSKRKKKQASIKSAFLRNERMFAEIAAQHCAAEQFDGEDVQLALAISQSEAENNALMPQETGEDIEFANIDQIREKLKKYGFRTADRKDYHTFAATFWPNGNGRRAKCKWANKFTALTLRNPDAQNRKLQDKVQQILNQQYYRKTILSYDQNQPPSTYVLLSSLLQQCQKADRNLINLKTFECNDTSLRQYFVEELFPVNNTPAGYLLKDWSTIPGRNLPAINNKNITNLNENFQKLEKAYKDLEDYYFNIKNCCKVENLQFKNTEAEQRNERKEPDSMQELNEMVALLEEIQSETQTKKQSHPKIEQKIMPPTQAIDLINISSGTLKTDSDTFNSIPSQRVSSPDLFADSDVEMSDNGGMESKCDHMKNSSLEKIAEVTTYELFTSDEAKNFSAYKINSDPLAEVIESNRGVTTTQLIGNNNTLEDIDLFAESPLMEMPQTSPIPEGCKEQSSFGFTQERYSEECNTSPLSLSMMDTKPIPNCDQLHNKTETEDERIFEKLRKKYLGDNLSQKALSNCTNVNEYKTVRKSLSFTQDVTRKCITLEPFSSQNFTLNNLSPLKTNVTPISIDLTQDDVEIIRESSAKEEEDEEFFILSDDEINYSIWKAAESLNPKQRKQAENFTLYDLSQQGSSIENNLSPKCVKRTEAAHEAQLKDLLTPVKRQTEKNWNDLSFLNSPSEHTTPMKRLSGTRQSKEKFSIFLSCDNLPGSSLMNVPQDSQESCFDEFDQLVYKPYTHKALSQDKVPGGLDQLLNGELKFSPLQSSPKKTNASELQRIQIHDKIYMVGVDETAKPDFTQLTETELLKRLYNFGIKPLKRKQAVKILEYIYNQTHPIIDNDLEEQDNLQKSSNFQSPGKEFYFNGRENDLQKITFKNGNKLSLCDSSGEEMSTYCVGLTAELRDEAYVLQTNITKKTSQPLLPLHIAWYNLLRSNPHLYENVLMYEPIDLQEIYQFFKNLGYRYDPKDLKTFFDKRCIIFRYDLAGNSSKGDNRERNRHVRKTKLSKKR